jgi:phospholipid/cholesterol/gamma-HCH transport system substrate-binding protein
MAMPLRFRGVNETAGAFVLATAVLVVAVVAMTGHAQRWFQPVRRLTVILPEEGSLGLRPGADVFILGVSVGAVEDIAPDERGRMRAEVSIRRDYSQFLHAGSTAIIRKTFGVAGDAYLEISRGTGAPLPTTDAVIGSFSDRAPTEIFDELLVQLREEGLPALKQARATMEEYRKVAADLRDPQGHLQQSLARIDRVSRAIERGEGFAGKLISDPAMGRRVEETTTKINASLDEADAMLKEIRKTAARLPATLAALDQTLQALPTLTMQTEDTMRQVQRLVEAAQKHWLIQGYVEPERSAAGRIPLDDIDSREVRP